eukprot:4777839-Amphidinium_carterae.1
MKATLPAFHSVRVTLLDSVESLSNKCSSYTQLQASLRQWTRSLRIAMTRYELNPEPRRLWLSLMSRISSLQNEPLFAAVLDRHMFQTGVRTVQTLDTVLAFTIALEAEVDAIVQDQGTSGQSTGRQARGNSAQVASPVETKSDPKANSA